MNAPRFPRVSLVVLCGVLVPAALVAQSAAQQAVEARPPEVGQAGKDVVWVPTPDTLVEKMLDLARLTPSDFLIDLGSGDGRTVIAAARRGARALGVEYNPDMVALSIANAAKAGVSARAGFVKADLFETDLSHATVVTLFLLPQINLKLRPTLLQLAPGTRIVSNSFDMGEWEADDRAHVLDGCASWCTALLWIVPARVDGAWRLGNERLVLRQDFQVISGTLGQDGGGRPVTAGRVRGYEVSFTVGTVQYTGLLNGAAMEGTATGDGAPRRWKATRVAD